MRTITSFVTTLSWVNLATPDWGSTLLAGRAALSAASGLRRDGLTECVDRLSIIIGLGSWSDLFALAD